MSCFYRYSTCFIEFILRPVTTGFLQFFAVPVHGSCILKNYGTGPVCGPSKKGNRIETGPDFFRQKVNVKLVSWCSRLSSGGIFGVSSSSGPGPNASSFGDPSDTHSSMLNQSCDNLVAYLVNDVRR